MINMQRLALLLFASSALLAAAPSAAPHVATFPVSASVPANNPDYYLGIAVLGHHVARVENHYLIKPPPGSSLHIDWSGRGPSWTTFTPGPQSEYDVSQKQLDAAARAVVALGVPPAAVHARMATAPVGFDNDHTNDKTLQVGVIMVDLGPYPQAAEMWKKFDRRGPLTTFDEFETRNHVNMPFIQQYFFGADCADFAKGGHDALVATAEQQARSIAAASGIGLSLIDVTQHASETPLCPLDQPIDVTWTQYTPPDLTELAAFSFAGEAHYAMSTMHHSSALALPKNISLSEAAYAARPTLSRLSTSDRYVITNASVSAATGPDAGAIKFEYRFHVDQDALDASIAKLSSLGITNQDVLKRGPSGSNNETTVLVRLDPITHDRAKQIQDVLLKPWFQPTIALYTRSCEGREIALRKAIEETREKAEVIAKLLHAKIGAPEALTVLQGPYVTGDCGADSSTIESLEKSKSWGIDVNSDSWKTAFESSVQVAWTLTADPKAQAPSTTAAYTGSSSLPWCFRAELAALRQAVQSAIIDRATLKSLAEQNTSLYRDYGKSACKNVEETVTVIGGES